MTTVIIKSDSDKKTDLLIKFAEELGLSAKTENLRELDKNAMVSGIGRKATDEELIDYLSKGNESSAIDLEEAFSKYTSNK